MDAVERARQIAAKFAGGGASTGGGSVLGKRGADTQADVGGKRDKIYLPVNEYPDVKFIGLIVGPGAATIKKLQADSGARIAIRGQGSKKVPSANPTAEDMEPLHIVVDGSDAAIARAKADIDNIIQNLDKVKGAQLEAMASQRGAPQQEQSYYGAQDSSEIIQVPAVHIGRLIGKGGEMSRRLQAESGARMNIAKIGSPDRDITLSGSPSAVADLKRRIQERIAIEQNRALGGGGGGRGASGGGSYYGGDSAAAALSQGGNHGQLDHPIVLKMALPHDKCGAVIGRGGSTIRALMERTQCTIKIPSAGDPGNPNTRTISVGAYTQEQADRAKDEIFAVIQQATQQRSMEYGGAGAMTDTFNVPDQHSGMVIGKGGSNIKALQARCQCRVQIPNHCDPMTNPPSRVCTLTGSESGVKAAKLELENLIAQANMGYSQPHTDHEGRYVNPGAGGGMSNPYGNAMAVGGGGGGVGGGGYYGPPAGGAPQALAPVQQGYYGNYGAAPALVPLAAPAPAAAPAVAAEEEEVEPQDDEGKVAYYKKKYWEYASYYGAKAARDFYGDWSPAEDEAPPPGIVVAADPVDGDGNDGHSDGTRAAGTAASADRADGQVDGEEEEEMTAAEREEHEAEMKAYRDNYRTWWLEHGKAAGAPEEPPEQ